MLTRKMVSGTVIVLGLAALSAYAVSAPCEKAKGAAAKGAQCCVKGQQASAPVQEGASGGQVTLVAAQCAQKSSAAPAGAQGQAASSQCPHMASAEKAAGCTHSGATSGAAPASAESAEGCASKKPVLRTAQSMEPFTGVSLMTATLMVKGMQCSHCAERVAEGLVGVAGVASAEVDWDKGTATVGYDGGTVTAASLREAVAAAGFEVAES